MGSPYECSRINILWIKAEVNDRIVCDVSQRGQRVLIAAHGNSLRALVKYLDNMTDAEIMALNIPTGIQLTVAVLNSLPSWMKQTQVFFRFDVFDGQLIRKIESVVNNDLKTACCICFF